MRAADLQLLGRSLRARTRSPALDRWLGERWCFEEHQLPAHPFRITLDEVEHRSDGKLFLGYPELRASLGRHGLTRTPSARLTRVVELRREREEQRAPGGRGEVGASDTGDEDGDGSTNRTPVSTPLMPATLTPLRPHDAIRTLWEATGVPLLPATRAALAGRIPDLTRRLDFGLLGL